MNPIESIFLTSEKKLIGYLTAGDPSLESLLDYIQVYETGGCDLIELGIPFSDPLADGPVIQAASERAIKNGVTPEKIFSKIKSIRPMVTVPLTLMVYYNTILQYGVEKFIEACKICEIHGLIVPDLPFESSGELLIHMDEDMLLIPFATPTSKNRMEKTLDKQRGFVYTVTSMGVTGRSSEFANDLTAYVHEVRSYTKLPIALGFGISSEEDIQNIGHLGEAVIVGSALVNKLHHNSSNLQVVVDFIKGLKDVLTKK